MVKYIIWVTWVTFRSGNLLVWPQCASCPWARWSSLDCAWSSLRESQVDHFSHKIDKEFPLVHQMSHDEPWWAMPSFKIQGAAWRSTGPEPRPSSRRSCLGGTVWRVPGMTRFLQLRAAARSASGDLRRSTSIKSFPLWFCSNLFLKTNHAFEAAMLFTSSKSKHPQFFWKPPSAAKLLATLWPWANWRKTSTITKAKDQIFIQISSLRSGSFRFRCLCVCVWVYVYTCESPQREHIAVYYD